MARNALGWIARVTGKGAGMHVDGALLLHYSEYPSPPSHADSVEAFSRHSRFEIYPVNIALGDPPGLDRVRFRAVILHHSMFWASLSPLSDRIREHLSSSPDLYKLALFQDEQSSLPERVKLCSELGIDCIYTCLESPYAEQIYGGTGASRIVSHLPGYVSERMRELGGRLSRPDDRRPIDIGYRGRCPPQDWQGAAREKYEIAGEFKRRAAGRGLVLDIETDEVKRIYGKAWPEFVARCKAMLGTESGADIVGPDGEAVRYRTTSPRHFESAALRTCQILFTGRYSGVLQAGTHYIPLAKDYSNVDEVLQTFSDPESRQLLTKQAFDDLIKSDRYSYASFIGEVDVNLAPASLGERDGADHRRVDAAMYGSTLRYEMRRVAHASRGHLRTAINRGRGRPATDALRDRRR